MQNKTNNDHIKDYLHDFKNLPCGVAVAKKDSFLTIVEANTSFYKIIGYTQEQFLNKCENRMFDILIDKFYDNTDKLEQNEECDFECDFRIKTNSATIRWIHNNVHFNAKQNLLYLISIDITDKVIDTAGELSYAAFQTRNEIMAYINLYTKEHIAVTDAITDEVIYLNPSAVKLLGFKQESDWYSKSYSEIGFGSLSDVHPSYNKKLSEVEFTSREYYNKFHNRYVHAESKIITVPKLNRKMKLHIITDITDSTKLKQKIVLQTTLHNCVDSLFTAGVTDKDVKETYFDILYQMNNYYQSDCAFFYKFTPKSHKVEVVYKVFSNGIRRENTNFSLILNEDQIKLMNSVSKGQLSDIQHILNTHSDVYEESLVQLNLDYNLENFSCVTIVNSVGEIIAFMGVSNPQLNEDEKELMDMLSRFIYMFIEHQHDHIYKEEAISLESISKTKLVSKCDHYFQNITHSKEHVCEILDDLCLHYDADFSLILLNHDNDTCYPAYIGGQRVPDLTPLYNQASTIMDNWVRTFKKHPEYVSDTDFVDLSAPAVKKILNEKFGIYNFIVSPIKGTHGKIIGLLFVNNFKLMNRSRLLVHVVAKNISDYLVKFGMYINSQLEPTTRLANKITTQNQITNLLLSEKKGTLFIIDIDNFKQLNDTLGHNIGDQAIMDVAANLKSLFRNSDIIGRVGGDEFMVFSPGLISQDLIIKKVKQLLEKCMLSYEKDGLSAKISVSIGICLVDSKCDSFQTLYENADKALYISKNNGKNNYHIDISI